MSSSAASAAEADGLRMVFDAWRRGTHDIRTDRLHTVFEAWCRATQLLKAERRALASDAAPAAASAASASSAAAAAATPASARAATSAVARLARKDGLPAALEAAATRFTVLDETWCLFGRQGTDGYDAISTSLAHMTFRSPAKAGADVAALCRLCPEALSLRWVPNVLGFDAAGGGGISNAEAGSRLVLLAPRHPGFSATARRNRLKLVRQRLAELAHRGGTEVPPAALPREPPPLPSAPTPEECDPRRFPAAPLRMPGATGLASASAAAAAAPPPETALSRLRRLPFYEAQIKYSATRAAAPAAYAALAAPLDARVLDAVRERMSVDMAGGGLFAHQATAINAARSGSHVTLATSTSSGKSLCFNACVLEAAVQQPSSCALYIMPTKALAQDQLKALRELVQGTPLESAVDARACDGDTGHADRDDVIAYANVIVTNPDLMHFTVLPNHKRWRRVLANLKYVVVDESHSYRGAWGAHVSAILRRLVRLCALYGSAPTFFCCSATVANPDAHTRQLLPLAACLALGGTDRLCVVDADAAPRGEKTFVVWSPPVQTHFRSAAAAAAPAGSAAAAHAAASDASAARAEARHGNAVAAAAPASAPVSLGAAGAAALAPALSDHSRAAPLPAAAAAGDEEKTRSAIVETALVFAALVKLGVRTIAFTRTRKLTELVARYALADLKTSAPHLVDKIATYRGGYTKADRRGIEDKLFNGELLGCAATCALELGIDIGNLDATLHLGVPSSAASLHQSAGRAGRGGRASLCVVVPFDSPLDHYYVANGEELFSRPPERAVLDACNETVLRGHLLCAAREATLGGTADRLLFAAPGGGDGSAYDACVARLVAQKRIVPAAPAADGTALYQTRAKHPSRDVNLRAIDPVSIAICSSALGGEKIDEVTYSRAFFTAFPGAIYLHRATQYEVTNLDLHRCVCTVRPVRVNYITQSRDYTDVIVMRVDASRALGTVSYGVVNVVCSVFGWRKVHAETGKVLQVGEFTLPFLEKTTRAVWFDVPEQLHAPLGDGLASAVHAASHALLSVAPTVVICDPADVETEHAYPYSLRPKPARIVLFDTAAGGIGLAASLYANIGRQLKAALRLVQACDCASRSGCPRCCHSGNCKQHNEGLDKRGAALILRAALALVDAEPAGAGGGGGGAAAAAAAAAAGPRDESPLKKSKIVHRPWVPHIPNFNSG